MRPLPSELEIDSFINNLNLAIPGLNLKSSEIVRTLAGVLPIEGKETQLSRRAKIWDHGKNRGIKGLYSVAGVKFTTSRLVADKTLSAIFPTRKKEKSIPFQDKVIEGQLDYDWFPGNDTAWLQPLQKIIAEEAVVHLDDLMLRRTSLGDNPRRALACGKEICKLLGKNEFEQKIELDRLEATLNIYH